MVSEEEEEEEQEEKKKKKKKKKKKERRTNKAATRNRNKHVNTYSRTDVISMHHKSLEIMITSEKEKRHSR